MLTKWTRLECYYTITLQLSFANH